MEKHFIMQGRDSRSHKYLVDARSQSLIKDEVVHLIQKMDSSWELTRTQIWEKIQIRFRIMASPMLIHMSQDLLKRRETGEFWISSAFYESKSEGHFQISLWLFRYSNYQPTTAQSMSCFQCKGEVTVIKQPSHGSFLIFTLVFNTLT